MVVAFTILFFYHTVHCNGLLWIFLYSLRIKLRALHALGAQLPNRDVFLHYSSHIKSTEILLSSQLCNDFISI